MDGEIVTNGFLEFDRTAMRSAFDLPLTEQAEPALDQIEPGAGSGREVQMKARMARKPRLHRRRLVGTVVIHDQMNVERAWHAVIDGAQELQELATAMTPDATRR